MAGRKKSVGPVNYFELPRKQLQTLCKKYGFPANKTNVLMAEFLTTHLNSEEYLNRDRSLPSPAVKTFIQDRGAEVIDSQEDRTEDSLPSISESKSTDSGMPARDLSCVFVNDDATQIDRTLASSKEEETCVGEMSQMISPEDAVGVGSSVESLNSTIAGSGTREASPESLGGSGQETPRLLSFSEESTNSTVTGSKTQESGQETPLPLSVMPYFLRTPEIRDSFDGEVSLFVDLNIDSLPSENFNISINGDNSTVYCQSWGAPPRTGLTDTTQSVERNLARLESQPVNGLDRRWTNGSPQVELTKNELSQASTACVAGSKKPVGTPLKSSIFNPKRKSSLKVSFLSPDVFPSPRNISHLVSDPQRSDIVAEWSVDENSDTSEQINKVYNTSDDEKAANDELVLSKFEEEASTQETHEHNKRTQQRAADIESPPEGIVEKVVKLYEEKRHSTVPCLITRKDSYKSSPFMKSSRIAAELDRASKLGQARRVGILAMKRTMGVVPMFSEPEDVEGISPAGTSSGPVSELRTEVVMSDAHSSDATDEDSHLVPGKADVITLTEILPSDRAPAAIPASLTEESLVIARAEVESDSLSDKIPTPSIEAPAEELMVVGSDLGTSPQHEVLMAHKAACLPSTVEESAANLSWMTKPIQLPTKRPMNHKTKEKIGRALSSNGRKFELMQRAVVKLKTSKKIATVREHEATCRPKTSNPAAAKELYLGVHGEPADVEEHTDELDAGEVTMIDRPLAEKPTEILSLIGSNVAVEDYTTMESSSAALTLNENSVPDKQLKILGSAERPLPSDVARSDRLVTSVDCETKNVDGNASEKLTAAISLLNGNFLQNITEILPVEISPAKKVLGLLDIDFTKVREKPPALGPIDSNRWAADTVNIENSPSPSTPYKASGIPLVHEVLRETEGKENNASGFGTYGKDNEWLKRQDQHKTPLTGRSKEKSLHMAEKKASNLREQLLRKRRGMEVTTDGSDTPLIQRTSPSPLKQMAMTRLL